MHRQKSEGAGEAGSLHCGQGCPFSWSSGKPGVNGEAGRGNPVSLPPVEGLQSAGGRSGWLFPTCINFCSTLPAVGRGREGGSLLLRGGFDPPRPGRLKPCSCPLLGPADGRSCAWGDSLFAQSVPRQLFVGAQGVALGQLTQPGQLVHVTSPF